MIKDEIIKDAYKLPESNGNFKKKVKYFIYNLKRIYWKIKHTFGCEERWLTESYVIRQCRKCGRSTITDPELQKAYRKGGLSEMVKTMRNRNPSSK